jgi:signal transduction histidine kinase/GAF domain-containing protein
LDETAMPVLLEASRIFGSPLGNLVYHLLLLLAVEAALGIAWGEQRRGQPDHARRLLRTMGGVALARAVYVAAALAVSLDWANPAMLPPLERFVDTASIILLGWAFIPGTRRRVRTWDLVLGANLILSVIACIAFVLAWNRLVAAQGPLDYNDSWQATAWSIWQVVLIPPAILALVRTRNEGWSIFVAAMLFMLAGQVLQLTLYAPVANIPAWARLGNLVAYPLVAVAVYQNVVAGLRVHSRQLQDISQASLDQIKSLLFLFEASQQMSGSLDLSTVLDNAVQGIARALNADQCAIAFLEDNSLGQMRLAAIYNPSRKGRGESVTFPLEYQLTVQQAMRRKKHIMVEESENVQLKVLFALLGSSETGPLLVQPLLADAEAFGAIIVGNARSRRLFTPNEAKLCQSMADQVTGAIQNARRHHAVLNQIEKLKLAQEQERSVFRQATGKIQDMSSRLAAAQTEVGDLRRREQVAREARNALEIKLVSRQAEVDTLSERLAVLETDLTQAHANTEAQLRWHEDELSRRQKEWEETAQAVEWSQAILQGMTVGMLVADTNGIIQHTNVAAEILLDSDSEVLRGLELVDVSDDDRWRQAVTTASGGEAVRLTFKVGSNTLMCDVAPLPDLETAEGNILGLVSVLQDITAETEEQRSRLEAVGSMAEELRTPMTTIVSYADLLLSETVGILGDVQRKFLLRIKAGAERIVQMIDDLNQEANSGERWTAPQRQTLDVTKMVEAAVASSSFQLEDKALQLSLDLPDGLPPIHADPDYLRRILANLISNACLASEIGGQIQVKAAHSNRTPFDGDALTLNGDEYVILSVQDSGGGLCDEALDCIFDRGRPSQTPQGLGESGAGLALVKTLVEAHGGRIWVENDSGVGATFSIILPADGTKSRSTAA